MNRIGLPAAVRARYRTLTRYRIVSTEDVISMPSPLAAAETWMASQ